MTGAPADAAIEDAVHRGLILRTHVLRPTWHFVTPADIRWLLALTGPRVKRAMASYALRQGVDAALVARAFPIIERSLEGGHSLTRGDLGARLARGGIELKGTALALLTMQAEVDGLICSGPYAGRHLTYALLEERAPTAPALSRDEALAELVRRYFQSHGPATLRDFNWWSGLPMADARRGLEIIKARRYDGDGLVYWTAGPNRPPRAATASVHLLPIYDEFTVAYRDGKPAAQGWPTMRSANGEVVTFQHALVVDGRVTGTWRVTRTGSGVSVDVTPSRRLTAIDQRALAEATARYVRFARTPAA
jgi:hypothetical protein